MHIFERTAQGQSPSGPGNFYSIFSKQLGNEESYRISFYARIRSDNHLFYPFIPNPFLQLRYIQIFGSDTIQR